MQLHNLIYQETPQKIVLIVIWQQRQLYDISNHVGATSIMTIWIYTILCNCIPINEWVISTILLLLCNCYHVDAVCCYSNIASYRAVYNFLVSGCKYGNSIHMHAVNDTLGVNWMLTQTNLLKILFCALRCRHSAIAILF